MSVSHFVAFQLNASKPSGLNLLFFNPQFLNHIPPSTFRCWKNSNGTPSHLSPKPSTASSINIKAMGRRHPLHPIPARKNSQRRSSNVKPKTVKKSSLKVNPLPLNPPAKKGGHRVGNQRESQATIANVSADIPQNRRLYQSPAAQQTSALCRPCPTINNHNSIRQSSCR